MLFNSFIFLVFLPVAFSFYWICSKNLKFQNLFILIASYVFYGWWDARFLILIFFSSMTDYICGLKIYHINNIFKKRFFLIISIVMNLGLLGIFKYYNFFVESFVNFTTFLGLNFHFSLAKIILPVGISFYTFQTLSYTIDIYRGKIKPTKDAVAFFAFVSFFPQLVAGPIERAKNLLSQFLQSRKFNYDDARSGLRQMLCGYFKKLVIADRLAVHADAIFNNYMDMSSTDLCLGVLFFAFQIYCDFSAYSDIAIGVARLFGFKLMRNFQFPYFSANIIEFWQRWHISLSTWFRDYVYIPLGGSRCSAFKHNRNIVFTFLLSGLWHGANWTFIFWGGLHSLYYLLTRPFLKMRYQHKNSFINNIAKIFQTFLTFIFVCVSWIFFRSGTLHDAFAYINLFLRFNFDPVELTMLFDLAFLCLFIVIEFFQRNKAHMLDIPDMPIVIRWSVYSLVIILIMIFHVSIKQFIYFQF